MAEIPWYAWIILAAIAAICVYLIVGGIYKIVKLRSGSSRDEILASNEAVLGRLEALDQRFARIERTLDEIPS